MAKPFSKASEYFQRKTNKHLKSEVLDKVSGKYSKFADDLAPKAFTIGGLGWGLGAVFGTSFRVNSGEEFLPALGKEIVEDSMFAIAPWTLGAFMANVAVQVYPDIKQASEQKKNFAMNYNYLGGDYVDTQSNYASRARAMEHIKRSRATMAAGVGGEARRYHKA